MNTSLRRSSLTGFCALALLATDVQASHMPSHLGLAAVAVPLVVGLARYRLNCIYRTMWETTELVGIDLQNDFSTITKAAVERFISRKKGLPVPGADEKFARDMQTQQDLARRLGMGVTLSRDWHPQDHVGATVNADPSLGDIVHPVKKPWFYTWTEHCVENTPGAKFFVNAVNWFGRSLATIVTKGDNKAYESYSMFVKVMNQADLDTLEAAEQSDKDGTTKEGFDQAVAQISDRLHNRITLKDGTSKTVAEYYRKKGIKRMFFTGVATDYCVVNSGIDAVKEGFEAFFIINGTRSVANIFAESAEAAKKAAYDDAIANKKGTAEAEKDAKAAFGAWNVAVSQFGAYVKTFRKEFPNYKGSVPLFYDRSLKNSRPAEDYRRFAEIVGAELVEIDSIRDLDNQKHERTALWWITRFFGLGKGDISATA